MQLHITDCHDAAKQKAVKVCRILYKSGQDASQPHSCGHDDGNGHLGITRQLPADQFNSQGGGDTGKRGGRHRIYAQNQSGRNSGQRSMGQRITDHGQPFKHNDNSNTGNNGRKKDSNNKGTLHKAVIKDLHERIPPLRPVSVPCPHSPKARYHLQRLPAVSGHG